MLIVIADDFDPPLLYAKRIVSDLGHEVLTAKNGAEAVDLCAQHRPDIAIIDISMPVMNGSDAARAIRAAGTAKHIVIASSQGQNGIAQPLVDAGAKFLSKPYQAPLLEALIDDLATAL